MAGTSTKKATQAVVPAVIPGREQLNTQLELNKAMERVIRFIRGDLTLNDGPLKGTRMPRFGIFTILARRTPFFVYDNEAFNKLCTSAFTDGTHVFFNADFFRTLLKDNSNGFQSVMPVVIHELSHILYRHHHRMQNFPRDIMNRGSDYIININIIRAFKESMKMGPAFTEYGLGFKDGDIEKFGHLSEESACRLLMEEKKEQEKNQEQQKGEPGEGEPQQGDGGDPGEGSPSDGQDDGQGKPQSGNGKPGQKSESHLITQKEVWDALNTDGLRHIHDQLSLPSNDKQRADRDKQNELGLIDDIQKASNIDRQTSGLMAGAHCLNYAKEVLKDLLQPKITWELKLQEMVLGKGMNREHSWEDPGDIYFVDPLDMGMYEPVYLGSNVPAESKGVILIIVDCSGSVDFKMKTAFFSEAIGVVSNSDRSRPEVIIVSADTVVRGEPTIINEYNYQEFMEEMDTYGCGGTDFVGAVNTAMALDIVGEREVEGIVYFTDLEDSPPRREDFEMEYLPPFVYVTVPSHKNQAFTAAVSDYADVAVIDDGVSIDMDVDGTISTYGPH